MEKENNGRFTITTSDGRIVDCDTLFTFRNPDTGKDYIVYTDNTPDENGNPRVYASTYTQTRTGTRLLDLTEDEEWIMVEELLEEYDNGEEE